MTLLHVALGLCLFTLGVHAFAGQRFVVRPLHSAALEPFASATLLVVWHMVTWTLALSCVALLLGVLGQRWLGLPVGLLCAGYALIFVVVAERRLREAIRLPQWILLGAVAVFAVAGSRGSASATAWASAGVLLAIAVVHLSWAAGASWPARDRVSLSLAVAGRAVLPSNVACLVVGGGLIVMAGVVLRSGSPLAKLAIALLFVARGTLGFVEPLLRREIIGTPYLLYSRYMYTPLSLALGAAVACGL
jgi:hypothetical protein